MEVVVGDIADFVLHDQAVHSHPLIHLIHLIHHIHIHIRYFAGAAWEDKSLITHTPMWIGRHSRMRSRRPMPGSPRLGAPSLRSLDNGSYRIVFELLVLAVLVLVLMLGVGVGAWLCSVVSVMSF